MKVSIKTQRSIVALVFAFGGCTAAVAQTTTTTTSTPSNGLEEIIVTARRVEENIQKVPITIQAFSAAQLREQGIQTTSDLQYAVPGIYLGGQSSRDNPNYDIRGQTRTGQTAVSPFGVVIYYDDVPLQTNLGVSVPPFDMSSIQVLKGPQGTLFGRNTTGGAILTYPVEPSYNFGGYASVEAGNFSYVEQEGAINLPLIDNKVAIRISAHHELRDGYTTDLHGPDQDNLDNESFRLQLRLDPTDWLHNLTIYDYYSSHTAGTGQSLVYAGPTCPPGSQGQVIPAGGQVCPASLVGALGPALGPLAPIFNLYYNQPALGTGSPYTTDLGSATFPESQFSPVFEQNYQKRVINKTTIDFGNNIELKNIAGYMNSEFYNVTNLTATPVPEAMVGNFWNYEQFSDELRLSGTAGRLEWLVGALYLRQEPSGINANDNYIPAVTLPLGPGVYLPVFPHAGATDLFFNESSKALFVHLVYDLGNFVNGLKFNAGYRYSWDTQDLCGGNVTNPVNFPAVAPVSNCHSPLLDPTSVSTIGSKTSAPTYVFGLDYQINDDLMTYVTTRRSYKAGGVNGPAFPAPNLLAPNQTFGPQTTKDLEVGLHSDFAAHDVKMQFNAAGFISWQYNIQDTLLPLQVSTYYFTPACPAGPNSPGPGAPFSGNCNPNQSPFQSQVTVNSGENKVQGLELEGKISPIQSLVIGANATFQEVKVVTPAIYAPNFTASIAPGSLPSVGTLYGFPKNSFNVYARYTLPFVPVNVGSLMLSSNYYHSGRVDYAGFPGSPAYGLTNVNLDWNSIFKSGVDAGLFLTNASDTQAIVGIQTGFAGLLTGAAPAIFTPPRMYGIRLRYRFGADNK